MGTEMVWPTAVKSFSGSKGIFERTARLMTKLGKTTKRVCPSGAERAAISPPIIVLAPGRLSTTAVWPSPLLKCSARIRLVRSAAPPGGKGTTMRIGFDGNVCAEAMPPHAAMARTVSPAVRKRAFIETPKDVKLKMNLRGENPPGGGTLAALFLSFVHVGIALGAKLDRHGRADELELALEVA